MDKNKNINQTPYRGGEDFFKQMIEEGIADDDFIREIVSMFLSEGAESLSKLKTAFQENDLAQVKLYAHKLKSSFLMFDMKEAHGLATELEGVNSENANAMQERLQLLNQSCQKHFIELKKKYLET
jgi:HPt (histidine-containing phosphotransfer) domain-containing protein